MLTLPSLVLPSPRTGLALAVALAASVSLGACTAQSGSTAKLDGEEGNVQEAVDAFSKKADDDDAAGICRDLLTPQAREALARGGDCAKGVQGLIDATDLLALDVDSVKITGRSAVATIAKTQRATDQTRLVLSRDGDAGAWRIAGFGNAAANAVGGTTPEAPATTPASTPAG